MVDPVDLGGAGARLPLAELALHLLPCLGSQHRRPADPLPLGPGPLLALDAAVPNVAPLPLGDGQSEVQEELAGGGGGVELPLGEDRQAVSCPLRPAPVCGVRSGSSPVLAGTRASVALLN